MTISIEFIGRIARYEEKINVMYMYEGIRNGEKIPEINLAIALHILLITPFLIWRQECQPVPYT